MRGSSRAYGRISAIPFRISQGDRSGESLITQGPVVDLFNRPHPLLNRFRFWEFIVTWYCLRGEVFIVGLDNKDAVVPIRRGSRHSSFDIRHLLVLPPDQFRHVVERSDLVGWKYTAAPLSSPLRSMALTPEEVIHDFLPNPYLFWRGMSPLSVALLAAQTDFASAQFMKGLMLNNADAGVIVRSDEQLEPEQRESLLAALRERKRSAGTADRPLLLWGTTEVIQPSLSSADLQFLENRKMNRQEICAAFFRIPQSLVGFTENANRSIAESERLNFLENSITPLCARLEAAIEPVVKAFGPDLVGWFDVDSTAIMQQARRSRVDTGVKLFSLGYPANAINKCLDLGLPNLTWGEKGYLPTTLQLAGEIPMPTQPKAAPSVFERLMSNLELASARSEAIPPVLLPRPLGGEGRGEGEQHGQQPEPPETLPAEHASRITHHASYQSQLKPRIKMKLGKVSAFFFNQRNRVLMSLEQLAEADSDYATEPRESASGHAPRTSHHATRTQQTTRSVAAIFDTEEETRVLVKKLSPLLRADLELGFTMIADQLGMDGKQVEPEQAASFLAQREKNLKAVNEGTFKELDASLLEGLHNAESLAQLVQRVKAIFEDARERRAPTIAESETTSAVNAGRMLGMQAGNVEKKGWQTADDEKVRDAHAAAEADYAKGIPIDEPFIVGGEALMYPGDANGSIGNVINCRCYSFPITGDEQQ